VRLLLIAAAGFPLTLVWGEIGASISVVASLVLVVILIYTRTMAKKIGSRLFAVAGFPWLACGITALGYLLLNRIIPWDAWILPLRLAVKLGYAALVFGGLLLLFQPQNTFSRLRMIWSLAVSPNRG
jgi:hypothetical protein